MEQRIDYIHFKIDAGLVVITAFISPFRSERDFARSLFDKGQFVEVFVDTPLDVCESRDPKGQYKKARAGLLPNLTGIGSGYEPPSNPEIRLLTTHSSVEETCNLLVKQFAGMQTSKLN